MDGLLRAVGNGITGLVSNAFDVIGGTLRYMVDSANNVLPFPWLAIIVFVGLAGTAWALAKR
jgi:hypothetical protein